MHIKYIILYIQVGALNWGTASAGTLTAHCMLQLYAAGIQSQNILSHGCLTVSERTEQFCVHYILHVYLIAICCTYRLMQ